MMEALEDCAHKLLAFRSAVRQLRNDTLTWHTSSQAIGGARDPPHDGTQPLELRRALGSALKLSGSMRNKRVPVNQLPPETLLHIFGLTGVPTAKKAPSHTLVLSHVCRHWRSVITSNPHFWTNVFAGPLTRSEFIESQFEHGCSLPLSLTLQLYHSHSCQCAQDLSVKEGADFCPHGNHEDYIRLLDIFSPHSATASRP